MIWQNSLSRRVWAALTASAALGLTGAFCRAVVRMVAQSFTARAFCRVLGKNGPSAYSGYTALLHWGNQRLYSTGRAFGRAKERSLLGRALKALHWRVACQNSLLAFSPRRAMLFLFALFLPLDVLLRAVLAEGPASLWDKIFMALGVLVVVVCRMRKKMPHNATAIDMPMLFLIAAGVFLWLTNSPDLGIGFDGLRAVVQYMAWYFIISRLIESKSDLRLFLVVFVALGAAIALHGIFQYITAAPMPPQWVSAAEGDLRTRAYSIIGSPNILGSLMVLTLPVAMALAYAARNLLARCAAIGAAGAMALACMFTFSRGAWIGMVLAFALFAVLVDRRLLLLLAVALIGAASVPSVAGRIEFLFSPEYVEATNRGGRNMRWDFGMDLWRAGDPVLGFGLGRFGGAVAMNNRVVFGMRYFYLDNYYIKTLVEMGLLGLFSFLWLCLTGLFQCLRAAFVLRKDKDAMPAAIFAGTTGVLAHCYFENIFEVPYMAAYFWALMAAAAVMIRLKRDGAQAPIPCQE